MKNQVRRGILATVSAVAAGAALALSGATAANAAPTPIDPDTLGSINITKLDTPTDGAVVNPNPTAPAAELPAGANPIGSVIFSVAQVTDVDLSTNAGWQAASLLTPQVPGALDTAVYGITGTDGVPQVCTYNSGTGDCTVVTGEGAGAAFQDLPIGVYLVTEVKTPPGVVASAPFLVTIPMTNPTNQNEWMYNVYVYPKNSLTTITKTVDDTPTAGGMPQANNPNAIVTWTIKADVPRIESQTEPDVYVKPTSFVITDQLDQRLLRTGTPTVQIVDAMTGVPLDVTNEDQLVAGDYTITPTDATVGETLTVTLTDNGLTKLLNVANDGDYQVMVAFNTLVQYYPACAETDPAPDCGTIGNGIIPNKASVNVNNTGAREVLTAVNTEWKAVSFQKVDMATTPNPVPNAEFMVYGPTAGAATPNTSDELLTATATSATDGTVDLGALVRSDWQNGASVPDMANYRVYWLVETKAPAGYELLAQPVPFIVTDAGLVGVTLNSSGVVTGVDDLLTNVVNVETNAGFTLPLTGGTGTLFLTVGGVALLAIVLVVARRRRATETTE